MDSSHVEAEIRQLIAGELAKLPRHLRKWAERHMVKPKVITAMADVDGSQTLDVWLVTDDVGSNDSSDRIVFDPRAKCFGRVTTLANGRLWYQGPQDGGFADAVQSL